MTVCYESTLQGVTRDFEDPPHVEMLQLVWSAFGSVVLDQKADGMDGETFCRQALQALQALESCLCSSLDSDPPTLSACSASRSSALLETRPLAIQDVGLQVWHSSHLAQWESCPDSERLGEWARLRRPTCPKDCTAALVPTSWRCPHQVSAHLLRHAFRSMETHLTNRATLWPPAKSCYMEFQACQTGGTAYQFRRIQERAACPLPSL